MFTRDGRLCCAFPFDALYLVLQAADKLDVSRVVLEAGDLRRWTQASDLLAG